MLPLLFFSSSSVYDIIVLTETWLSECHYTAEIFDCQLYNVFRKDRCSRTTGLSKGGGVLVAVSLRLPSTQITLSPNMSSDNGYFDVDQIIIKINLGKSNELYISVSYIPPSSPIELYKKHVNNCCTILDSLTGGQNIIILGDFNLPNVNWCFDDDAKKLVPYGVSSESECEVLDTFAEYNLCQINRVHNDINRLLDLVFISNDLKSDVESLSSPPLPNSIYHKALCVRFKHISYIKSVINNCKNYNFYNANFNQISRSLDLVDWETVLNKPELSQMYDDFVGRLERAIHMFVPIVSAKNQSKPAWYNSRLINLNNKKTKAYKLYRKSKNNAKLYEAYNRLQKEFDVLNKFLYQNYISKVESGIKENCKSFWQFINGKKKTTGIPDKMHYLGETLSDIQKISNLFADFFRSVYVCQSDTGIGDTTFNSSRTNKFFQLSSNDVLKSLSALANDPTPGEDGFPPILLKNCATSLAKPLTIIFNKSLASGEFLHNWKKSFIIPIHKSGSKSEVQNYRPICKISCIPKLFEKLVHDLIFFQISDLISPNQHGFVKGRSTVTNLGLFANFVSNQFETGQQCDVIFTDFSKAFDRVSHSILLKKLGSIGLHPSLLKWLASYLTDRTQFVRINNIKSDAIKVTSGVPQGSHLGPLLFLMFVNDIPDVFKTSRCLMYADDLKIYSRIEDVTDCIRLQKDLTRLEAWCDDNSLPLNAGKCQQMSFSRRKVMIAFDYKLGTTTLKKIYEKKDLGVIFTPKMSFSKHIDFMIAKSRSMLGFVIRNSREFQDISTLRNLYFSLVRSNLEYCSIIWDPFYMGSSLRIEKVQKRFTRFAIHSLRWPCSLPAYKSRCLLLALPTLEMRRKISSVMFIRDIVTNHIKCHFLLELILFNCPTRNLRLSNMFHLPYHKTNFSRNEPLARCIRQSNQLCKNLDIFSNSRETFKSKLDLEIHFLNCG